MEAITHNTTVKASVLAKHSEPALRAPVRAVHSRWYPRTSGPHRKSKDKEGARTSYPGMDRTASTTARDIKCWTNGILCPSCDLRGMQTSRVKRAHPTGLSQAFGPLPGKTDPLIENCFPMSQSHTPDRHPSRLSLSVLITP